MPRPHLVLIWIPESIIDYLKKIAFYQEQSVESVILSVLEDFVEKEKEREKQWIKSVLEEVAKKGWY